MTVAFYLIEFGCYAFYLACLPHAWRQGARWLVTMVAALMFGLAVELAFLYFERGGSGYSYATNFFVMVGWSSFKVPLWVGTGWASIVYAATLTASRLSLPAAVQGVLAGLLAMSLDIGLDPIAEALGFWTWRGVPPTNYFGVPFDNFLGWFMIVGGYSLSVLWLFGRVPARWRPQLWAPFAACVPALLITAGGQLLLNKMYEVFAGQALPFMLVIGGAIAVIMVFGRAVPHNLAPDRYVLTLPLYYHALYFTILMVSGVYRDHGAFVMVIPLGMFLSFIAFAWGSFDRVFARPKSALEEPTTAVREVTP